MVTLFTTPKPFRGHFAVIQRNALRSWTLLRPACEVILFGNEEGTAEIAREFSVRHVSEVARNEYRTPLVSDMFDQARQLSHHDLICYLNADILLMSDFMGAIGEARRRKRSFVMVGRRWDTDLEKLVEFGPAWEERLRAFATENGRLCAPSAIDYFVAAKDFWGKIPPFAIGRPAWDNWMLYRARAGGAALIDATPVVMAIHQNHDYSHCADSKESVWRGPEARQNRILCGGDGHLFNISDATYLLTASGLKINVRRSNLMRHLRKFALLHPYLGLPLRLARAAFHVVRFLADQTRAGLRVLGFRIGKRETS